MMSKLSVTPELGPWGEAWDQLVAAAPVPSPFLRRWWLEGVTEGRAVYVLLADGNDLIGGLALEERRPIFGVQRYRFAGAGTLCPDHLDAVAAAGREKEVADALHGWISRRGSRIFDLTGVVEGSILSTIVKPSSVEVVDVAPYGPLPETTEAYMAARSANFRSSTRRAARRLEAAGLSNRTVPTSELPQALDAFERIHAERPDRAPLLAELPRLRRALEAGVRCGEAKVDVFECDGAVVSVSLSFVLGGRVSKYQNARSLDPQMRSVGTVADLTVVNDAIRAGCHEVDTLRGAEPYKFSFAGRSRDVMRIRVSHGKRGAALLAAWRFAIGLHHTARRARDRSASQRATDRSGPDRRLTPE